MLSIFVSKSEDDQLLAKRLRQELLPYLGNDVEVKMSQDIPAGENWKEWIKSELRQTDLLLFLITDVNKSLDWCIFELGMFTPLSDREPQPIVCIYPANQKMPTQIHDVQGIECVPDKIKGFLKDLFDGPLLGKSINRRVAEDETLLNKLSEKIVKILTPESISSVARVYYTRYISFEIEESVSGISEIPPASRISGDELSLEVFKLDKTKPDGSAWTWEQFKPYLAQTLGEAGSPNDEFFKEFEESIIASCRGEKISPMQYYIRSLTSEKKYHPVIHRRDFLGENHLVIRVLLVHEPEPETGERNFTFAAAPGE